MLLIVTFVSVKSSTEKKKHCILHECRHFLKDQHKLRAHACVKNNENDDDYLK